MPPPTRERGTTRPGTPRELKPKVQQTMAASLTLDFDTWVFSHEVTALLFRDGTVPPRHTLEAQRGGGNPAMRWVLRWESGAFDIHAFSAVGERLWYRVLQGGDEFAEDTSARLAAAERAREANRAHNNMYVPALGMTGGQALASLAPGLYVAAMPYGIVPVPPLVRTTEWKGWPDVGWVTWYAVRGGWFAWRGERLEMHVLGRDNPQFWKEVVHYVLHEGDSLYAAVDKFCKRWDEINTTMLAAFAIALTSAPSMGRRADLTDAVFGQAISNSERGLARAASKDFSGSVLRHVDPGEAAHVALAAAARPWEALKGLLAPDEDEMNAEAATLVNAALTDLRRQIDAQAPKICTRDLRTGEMGEATFKLILKARGYSVVELQNPSGHGVDLVAIKVKGGVAWIYFFEIKSSEKDYPGRFSDAQRDPHGFVKSRLQRVIDRDGHYKSVPQSVVDIATQIKAAIEDGHPVGSIKVGVHWAKSLATKVSVEIWRPMPKATARPRK